MSYEDTVKKWDDAARGINRKAAIHPSGGVDEEAYELSGFQAARRVLRAFPGNKYSCVVDFGCGDGRVLRHLCGRYGEAYGFDTSEKMVEEASINCAAAKCFSSLHELAIEAEAQGRDGDCIGVYSYAVFIHHRSADGAAMLKQIARYFPRATLALQIPLYEVAREPTSWTDVGVWTLPMLESAADAADLRVERAYVSPGEFSYDHVGHSHNELQVLTRKA